MHARAPLWVKHLLFRLPASLVLLTTAILTAGAAALGPLYARAAGESVLRDELVQSAPERTGLRLHAVTGAMEPPLTVADYSGIERRAPPVSDLFGYSQRIGTLQIPSAYANAPGVAPVITPMVWRAGVCAHLRITAGRCPARAGEVVVAARTVAYRPYGWRLGGSLRLSGVTVRIVGEYRPRDTAEAFWFGNDYFIAAPGDSADLVDSVFVTRSGFDALPSDTSVEGSVDYLLDPARIRLNDLPKLRRQTTATIAGFRSETGLEAGTQLPKVLDAAADQRRSLSVGTLLVTLQSVLLGWLVFFLVAADAIEARGSEIALAKLRGLSPRRTVLFALAEPVGLMAVAVPLGAVLAVAATHAFAGSVLVPGTPVLIDAGSVLAPVGAFAGGAAAATLAARRVLTRPVLEQWRRTVRGPDRRAAPVGVGVAVAAVAAAGFVLLRLHPAAGQGALLLLAPGLLVLAVAVVGIGLLPLVLRLGMAPTRASRRIGLFLAVRQVVRRPAGLRLGTVLAVAVGLATFGVAGETVSATNRAARAEGETGATRSLSVQVDAGVDPVRAVRRADPDGRWGMAAATWLPDGGETVAGTVLAVDTARLAALGLPARGGPDPAALARVLRRGVVPPIEIRGTRIRATITAGRLSPERPMVRFDLVANRGGQVLAEAGALRPGRHDYRARIPCATGCTLAGITWDRPFDATSTVSGTATVSAVAVAAGTPELRPVDLRLGTPTAWRPASGLGDATDAVTVDGRGMTDRFSSTSGYGGIVSAAVPNPLPAVAIPGALATGHAHGGHVTDVLNADARFVVRRSVPVLPVVLDDGVLLDASAIESELPGFAGEAHWRVWLSPSAPSDVGARLARVGLPVQSEADVAGRVAVLARQGPALSLLLLFVSAAAGTLLAGTATAAAIGASARRRSYEAAAMAALGVRIRRLFGAALIEQLLLLGSAVVLGLPAGLLAAIVALPVVPEFATPTPIELRYLPAVGPLLAAGAVFALVVTIGAAIAAAAVVRSARADRLREDDA